jgi:hypothetical protein
MGLFPVFLKSAPFTPVDLWMWPDGILLFAPYVYIFSVLFVFPIYLILMWSGHFNRFSSVATGVVVGGLIGISGFPFGVWPNWRTASAGAAGGLVAGYVFYVIRGTVSLD